MPPAPGSVWHTPNFVKLWAGQTISLFGSSITLLAIPLTAVTQLAATPVQMGLLQSLQFLPFLLFGLLAGVWIDRLPRRPILIGADIGRAAALAVIPLAAWGGWLRMGVLYGVSFVVGTLNLLFEAAYAAILPSLVPAEQLAAGNSRLQASAALAEIAGPGLAGWLVQAFTAAVAVVGDALSFMASAALMTMLRVEEAAHAPTQARVSLRHELVEGLSAVLRHQYIRPLTLCSGASNIFINMHLAIYVLYLAREMGFTPAQIGLLYSVSSVGGLLGALAANRVAQWLGLGRAIISETVAVGVAATAIPLVSTLGPSSLPLLALLHGLWGFWLPIYIVNAASLRQLSTPNQLLGRVTASARFISWGAATVGFLLGGIIGERLGLLPALYVAGCGLLLAPALVIFSAIRGLQAMPEPFEPARASVLGS